MEIEKRRSFIINFVYFLILIGGVILAFKYVVPALSPFIIAFLISYVLRRPIRRICRKLNAPHKPVALAVVTVFYIIIGGIITVATLRLAAYVSSGASAILHLYTVHVEPAINEIFGNMENVAYKMDPKLFSLLVEFEGPVSDYVSSFITRISVGIMAYISEMAYSLPGTLIEVVIIVISTFFISADYQTMTGFCLDQLSEKARTLFLHIKEYVIGTLFVCFRSYAIIMFLTFIQLSLAFMLLKMQHAMPIAALISLFDILPILGVGGILIPWGLFALMRGQLLFGIELLGIYLIVTVIRNIIEPKIVGKELGLHPVVTLASMTLGASVGGIIGLFGAPILLSLLMHLNNEGTIKLFNTSKITVRPNSKETNSTETTV